MRYRGIETRSRALRVGGVVIGSTLALTMSFFGMIALLTGDAGGALDRLPVYVLGLALSFVAGLVTLDDYAFDGETVLALAAALAGGTFLLVGFASEGIVYAARNPGSVVSSKLFLYVLSAGLIATGLGFWVARYYDGLAVAPGGRL
jgi:hypothetical protein